MEGGGVADVVQAVAVFEPGRELGAVGFVLFEVGEQALVERKVGDAMPFGDAADGFVVAVDLGVGLVREILANRGEGEDGDARGGLVLEALDDEVEALLVPLERRRLRQVVERHVAEMVPLAHGGVDVVGSDEDGDEFGRLGDHLVEALEAVPRDVTILTVIHEAEAGQRGACAEQLEVIVTDCSCRQTCAKADDGFHGRGILTELTERTE